jgi:dienelactone hydrolase
MPPVVIPSGVLLQADLERPQRPSGVVAFAHGSGSGRFSPRNRLVAERLREHGHATLLLDLLTREEETVDEITGHLRFDIGLLADRMVAAVDWLSTGNATRGLPIGLFGASTGAAAALVAAARRPGLVRAVVSRGGRPDLALDALLEVRAPTLLLVGALDDEVLILNRQAAARMPTQPELEIVGGATHLFEETGTLERVAELAAEWFDRYLTSESPAGPPSSRDEGSSAPS